MKDMGFCIEVIELYVDGECGDITYLQYYNYFYVSFFLVSSVERVLSGCSVSRRWNIV